MASSLSLSSSTPPLGLGGFVCRALQHLLDVLEAWLALAIPWLLWDVTLLPILLDPWEEEDLSDPSEDASKAEAKYKPEVAVAAADADVPCPGTLALWKVLSVSKRYCLLPGERIMAWSGLGQQEDPRWSPGRGCSVQVQASWHYHVMMKTEIIRSSSQCHSILEVFLYINAALYIK